MGLIPALSDCKPGFEPFEYNVIIAPEEVQEKTAGGLFLPEIAKEREGLATVRGRLVSVSPAAFDYATFPEGTRFPRAGDEVIFAKFAGILIQGDDGREYRLCKDRDIAAVVTRAEPVLAAVAARGADSKPTDFP